MDKYIKKHNLKNLEIIEGCHDVKPYLLTSDLLLVTSHYEGFHLVTLEANSLSCPVLWVNCGDPTSDMVHKEHNGDIVDSRDPKVYALKLKEILENKKQLIKWKKSSYEHSKQYKIEHVVDAWCNLFESHHERIK